LAPGQTIALTGTHVTFDAAALTLNSFQFSDAGPTTVTLTGPLSASR